MALPASCGVAVPAQTGARPLLMVALRSDQSAISGMIGPLLAAAAWLAHRLPAQPVSIERDG